MTTDQEGVQGMACRVLRWLHVESVKDHKQQLEIRLVVRSIKHTPTLPFSATGTCRDLMSPDPVKEGCWAAVVLCWRCL